MCDCICNATDEQRQERAERVREINETMTALGKRMSEATAAASKVRELRVKIGANVLTDVARIEMRTAEKLQAKFNEGIRAIVREELDARGL